MSFKFRQPNNNFFFYDFFPVSFEGAFNGAFLLGDSGYKLRRYLLTPILVTSTPAEESYNKSHCSTRVKIEQCFGVLKHRFGCLHGELRCTPERACTIICACFVLHNMATNMKQMLEEEEEEEEVIMPVANVPDVSNDREQLQGKIMRNHIVNGYFE